MGSRSRIRDCVAVGENSRMMLQLNPSMPVKTPQGVAMAIGWIDYGPEHDLIWIVIDDNTRECWCVGNRDIRFGSNETYGRKIPRDK